MMFYSKASTGKAEHISEEEGLRRVFEEYVAETITEARYVYQTFLNELLEAADVTADDIASLRIEIAALQDLLARAEAALQKNVNVIPVFNANRD